MKSLVIQLLSREFAETSGPSEVAERLAAAYRRAGREVPRTSYPLGYMD